MTTRNWALFFVMALLWGSSWSAAKTGLGLAPPFSFSSQQFLLSAVAMSPLLATVYFKKYLGNVNVMATTALQFSIGSLPLFALSGAVEGFVFPLNSEYLGILLFMSLGATVVGNMIWLFLLRQEDATSLSTYSFIIPIIALIFGWWLLGESIDGRSLLGSALIIAGLYLVQRD